MRLFRSLWRILTGMCVRCGKNPVELANDPNVYHAQAGAHDCCRWCYWKDGTTSLDN